MARAPRKPKRSAAKNQTSGARPKRSETPAKKAGAQKGRAAGGKKRQAKPTGKKPARRSANGKGQPATRKKTPAKKKPSAKGKRAAKKAQSSAAKKTASIRSASPSRGTTTDSHNVRPRFTEPLRRFGEFQNVRELITGQAQAHGDRTFMIFEDDGREYSFRVLDDLTTRVANVLHDLGAVKGARVAILLPNSPSYVFTFLGTLKGGFIAVPLNFELSDDQLLFQLKDCGAEFVVTQAGAWDRIGPLLGGQPGLKAVLVAGHTDGLDPTPEASHKDEASKEAGYRLLDLQGCLDAADGEPLKTEEIGWWDEAQIVYTGSNKEQPHGAILQHRQFVTSARWLSIWLQLGQEQRFMSSLPLFHANAQVVSLFTPLQIGASVVLNRAFNVARVWSAVERYGVTVMSAVPSMLGILADRELNEAGGARPVDKAGWPAPHESPGALGQRDDSHARDLGLARGHDISSLERVICGAAPLPAAVQKAFEQVFLVPVIEGYSMAETTGFAMLNPGNGTRRIGSVGVAVGNKVCIQAEGEAPATLDDNWQPTALKRMNPTVFPTALEGTVGEICIWGENVLKEYYQRPEVNPHAFAGGWFHTGDLGHQDADGYFFVHGAKEEAIDLEDGRLMPREVDELLFAHTQVEEAATVGAGDSESGRVVTTWVVMRRGTFPGGNEEGRLPSDNSQLEAMRREIATYLGRHLTEGKRPTAVRFAHRLPRDAAGKARIVELRRLTGIK